MISVPVGGRSGAFEIDKGAAETFVAPSLPRVGKIEVWGDFIDDELLQNMQQLISAACASRGRWGG